MGGADDQGRRNRQPRQPAESEFSCQKCPCTTFAMRIVSSESGGERREACVAEPTGIVPGSVGPPDECLRLAVQYRAK